MLESSCAFKMAVCGIQIVYPFFYQHVYFYYDHGLSLLSEGQ
jgi:hypothetical protein